MVSNDLRVELALTPAYTAHVQTVTAKLKQLINRPRCRHDGSFVGEIRLIAVRGDPEHGDFDEAQWRCLKEDLSDDDSFSALFHARQLVVVHKPLDEMTVDFQWAAGDRKHYALVVSCPCPTMSTNRDAPDMRAALRERLAAEDYDNVDFLPPEWAGRRDRVCPVMSLNSRSLMFEEPPPVAPLSSPPYRGVMIGPAGVGKTALFNIACGTRHRSAPASASLTRQIYEHSMVSGDFNTSLRDTPALASSVDPLQHALLLWHGLCTERVNAVFIMLGFEPRWRNLVDKFAEIRNSYLQGRTEYYDRVVLVVSKWDQAGSPEDREQNFQGLQTELAERVSPDVPLLCLSAERSPGSMICNMLSYFMRAHAPVLIDLEKDKFLVTAQNIASLTAELRQAKCDFEEQARETMRSLGAVMEYVEQQDKDDAALFLIAEYNERLEKQKSDVISRLGDQMVELEQFCVWVDMQESAVSLTDQFRDMMIAHMSYRPDDPNDHRNQIKKCPHCECVWVRVAGCDRVQCGNVTNDYRRASGNDLEKQFNWRHRFFSLVETASGFLQLRRVEPPEASPASHAAPKRRRLARPLPINPTLYPIYDGPLQDSSPRAGCGAELSWDHGMTRLSSQEIQTLFSVRSVEAAVEEFRKRRQPGQLVAEAEAALDTTIHLESGEFATSRFKRLYEGAQVCDAAALRRCVRNIVLEFSRRHEVEERHAEAFISTLACLILDAYPADEPKFLALRLWTSASALWCHGRAVEFCHMVNEALVKDEPDKVVRFVRTLNLFVNSDRVLASPGRVLPAVNTYRGGGLPDEYQAFFAVEKKYRAPRVLPTTTSIARPRMFMQRQHNPYIRWTFQFQERCLHVNYVDRTCPTVIDDEEEYIFPPYSVFTVVSVLWREAPTPDEPHEVTVRVSEDNKSEPLDLPTAPWC